MPLERELELFKERQEEFAENHYGKYVVIHEDNVEFFDDEIEAYTKAKDAFGAGRFLLRRCIRQDEETIAVFHSRAA